VYLPRGCGGRGPLTMLRHYRTERHRQRTLASYRGVVVASSHVFAEYERHGVPAERLHLLPLFAPGSVPAAEPPAPRGRTDRVLFTGRITPQKGLEHLIEAVPRAAAQLGRRLTLVVTGDGPARAAAEAAARRLGVAAEFPGWVNRVQRDAEMRGADVLGVPSVWPEPFGLVGLEAGCVGLPAAAYPVGGITDWLRPGESGELAAGGVPNPVSLAAAIVRALATDDHWQKLRVGAWRVAGEFTEERHVARLVLLLRAVA
jgi:glycosyltransferase involved in cell wall biosynthesis